MKQWFILDSCVDSDNVKFWNVYKKLMMEYMSDNYLYRQKVRVLFHRILIAKNFVQLYILPFPRCNISEVDNF